MFWGDMLFWGTYICSYKFICVYIVFFDANITKIGTRSYHSRFTQSNLDKEGRVAV